jgi:hypothetical protein
LHHYGNRHQEEEMSATHTADPHVDLAPDPQARPGLALLLAILAVPGSTIAWDLPAGGLWIGLPLGVAAIVLGAQARARLSTRRGTATAAIIIGGLAILSMVAFAIGSAAS